MMPLQTVRDAGGSWVIAFRGAIDSDVVDAAVKELARCSGGPVIFDLLRAQLVDVDVLDDLVEAGGSSTTFVAERPLHDALRVIGLRRDMHLELTLAAALN